MSLFSIIRADPRRVRSFRRRGLMVLLAALGAFMCLQIPVRGEIPVTRDVLTGEIISAQRIERTKQSGLRLLEVNRDSPAQKAGLHKDDLILAIDSIRFYGFGEYTLATMWNGSQDFADLLLNRNGEIMTLRVTGLMWARRSGFRPCSGRREFAKLLRSVNLALSPETQAAVTDFPPRATALAREWIDASMSDRRSAQWLVEFADLYAALVNLEYGKARAVKAQMPVPFFRRLEKFYLAIANHNRNGEKDPDAKAFGEDPEFCALFYPFPRVIVPGLGSPAISDDRLLKLIEKRMNDGDDTFEERMREADAYAGRPSVAPWEDYLNKVKSGLIESVHHGGWILKHKAVADPGQRKEVIRDLEEAIKNGSPDQILLKYCLLVPKMYNGKRAEVLDLFESIYKESPCLALTALASLTRLDMGGGPTDNMVAKTTSPLNKELIKRLKLDPNMTRKPCRFYDWTVEQMPRFQQLLTIRLAETTSGEKAGLAHSLRREPASVVMAFGGGPPSSLDRKGMFTKNRRPTPTSSGQPEKKEATILAPKEVRRTAHGELLFTLADGSTVIGKPSFPSIIVTFSFGDVVFTMEKIVAVEFSGKNGAAELRLRNGDIAKGKVKLGTFTVEAKDETIPVDGSQVKSIQNP